ncbi:MAG: pantoate--beta-alanine ligase [Flavobacteriaceae bacterium]|nr:pantoate--beta-alanine ligase [Flavobacteriaceae bacterium]
MQLYTLKSQVEISINKAISLKKTIGLVPTMGSLHQGHLSLLKKAVQSCEVVWVTIFVNPTQFNSKQDLNNYPKNITKDLEMIYEVSKNINVFNPEISEMYENKLKIENFDFQNLDKELEGKYRNNHFSGVGTIVSKLFNIIKPNKAFFGEKDFQQTRIIDRLIKIKKFQTELIICPTVREKNGLALSSRNALLSTENKNKAAIIYKTLIYCKENLPKSTFQKIYNDCKKEINSLDDFELEYLEITENETLKKVKKIEANKSFRIFICVLVNGVRLIDNILVK